MIRPPPRPPLFPYTTLFRSLVTDPGAAVSVTLPRHVVAIGELTFAHNSLGEPTCFAPASAGASVFVRDRKSTRLNSSHMSISYAVFCLKKKNRRLRYIHRQH